MIERPEGEKLEGGGIGRKRTRKGAALSGSSGRSELTDRVGQSKGMYVGPPIQENALATPGAYQFQSIPQGQYGHVPAVQHRPVVDRSILTAAGGGGSLGANARTERLPAETCEYAIMCTLISGADTSCSQILRS